MSADEQRLLASYVLDSISSWTSVTLTVSPRHLSAACPVRASGLTSSSRYSSQGFSDPNLLPELEALDEACLNATISAAQVVSLVDEHRASRSRAHLVQTWSVALLLSPPGRLR